MLTRYLFQLASINIFIINTNNTFTPLGTGSLIIGGGNPNVRQHKGHGSTFNALTLAVIVIQTGLITNSVCTADRVVYNSLLQNCSRFIRCRMRATRDRLIVALQHALAPRRVLTRQHLLSAWLWWMFLLSPNQLGYLSWNLKNNPTVQRDGYLGHYRVCFFLCVYRL